MQACWLSGLTSALVLWSMSFGAFGATPSYYCPSDNTGKKSYDDALQKSKDYMAANQGTTCAIWTAAQRLLIRFPTKDTLACKVSDDDVAFNSTAEANSASRFCFVQTPSTGAQGEVWILKLAGKDYLGEENETQPVMAVPYVKNHGTNSDAGIATISFVSANADSWIPAESNTLTVTIPRSGGAATWGLLNKFSWYGEPKITATNFNGEIEIPYSLSITRQGLTIAAKGEPMSGRIQILIKNDFLEEATLNVDVETAKVRQTDPSLLSLMIELSLTQKLIADEQFLRADKMDRVNVKTCGGEAKPSESCRLWKKYREARATLPQCRAQGKSPPRDDCSNLTKAELSTVGLIEADVDYRTVLLEQGIAFFGGYRTLKQTTPHQELIKLKDLLRRMTEMADRMERLQWRTTDLALRNAEVSAERTYVMGQIKSEQINSEKEQILSTHFDGVIEKNIQRKRSLEQIIVSLNDKADRLSKEQDGLDKTASGLIQNGIAAASGLPLNEVKALAEGDIQKVVSSYVQSQISDKASEYAKQFTETSDIGKSLGAAYQKFKDEEASLKKVLKDGEEYTKQVKELQRQFDSSVATIRAIGEGQMRALGDNILRKLNAAQQAQIDRVVELAKPVSALLDSAQSYLAGKSFDPKLMAQFQDSIARAYNKVDSLRTKEDEFKKELLQKTANMSATTQRFMSQQIAQVLSEGDTIVNAWQSLVVLYPDLLETQTMSDVLSKVKDTDRALARSRLLSFDGKNPSLSPIVKVSAGNLQFDFPGSAQTLSVKVSTLVDELKAKRSMPSSDAINEFVDHEWGKLDNKAKLVLHDSGDGFEGLAKNFNITVARLAQSPKDKRDAIEGAWKEIKKGELFNRAEVLNGPRAIVAASLGQASKEDGDSQGTNGTSAAGSASGASSSGIDPTTDTALKAALNYALPGAGIALQLGQTYAAMSANHQLLEQIERETVAALAEYNQTQAAIDQANINSVVAKKEEARAQALADASKAQLEQFNSVMDIALTDVKETEAKLRLYRPYFFYVSELLRERFDAFDRSLAVWSTGRANAGFFAKQIRSDPRSTRLALDSEIHLYDWLNREREASKTDPYHLFNHWQQLVSLADDYCADYGCKPGDGKLGKIAATVPVKLLADLGGEDLKKRFKQWREAGSRDSEFSFTLAITRAQKLLPRSYVNVRLLDLNLIPITRAGDHLRGNMIKVRHSGFALIPLVDKSGRSISFASEQLLPNSSMPPSNEDAFNLTALAARFQSQVDMTSLLPLRGFEGYGFYGALEFTVNETRNMRDVDDFEIQFAYVYQEAGDILTERDVISRLDTDGSQCGAESKANEDGGAEVEAPHFCQASLILKVERQSAHGGCEAKPTISRITDADAIRVLLDMQESKQEDADGNAANDKSNMEALLPKCVSIEKQVKASSVIDMTTSQQINPYCSAKEIIQRKYRGGGSTAKCYGEPK